MLRFYKYVFYRFYYWNRIGDIWGHQSAVIQAVSQVGMLLVLQFFVALELVESITGYDPFKKIKLNPVLVGGGFAAVLVIGLMFYLGGESGYKEIIEEFDNKKETRAQKLVSGFAIWFYIIGLIGLFFFLIK